MTAVEPAPVRITAGDVVLDGDLTLPPEAVAVVVFAHGSGSSRRSTRNRQVASALNEVGLGTLLFDLLTSEEEVVDERTRELRFDIDLLARRLIGTVDWLAAREETRRLRLACFGASTGAAAALVAAAERPDLVGAVVSRGGRPDLAREHLAAVRSPTLLIVGGADEAVLGMNQEARDAMTGAEVTLEVVPGASHLFGEPGALEEVSRLAREFLAGQVGGGR